MNWTELICGFVFGIAMFLAGFLFGTDFGIYIGKRKETYRK